MIVNEKPPIVYTGPTKVLRDRFPPITPAEEMAQYHEQSAPTVIYAPRRAFLPTYLAFLIKWSPLLILGFISRESHLEWVGFVCAIIGVGYIFYARMGEGE